MDLFFLITTKLLTPGRGRSCAVTMPTKSAERRGRSCAVTMPTKSADHRGRSCAVTMPVKSPIAGAGLVPALNNVLTSFKNMSNIFCVPAQDRPLHAADLAGSNYQLSELGK